MAEPQNPDDAPKRRSPLMGRLFIALFMGGVVLTECMLAYFVIPSAEEIEARAESMALDEAQKSSEDQAERAKEEKPAIEIDLGTYDIVIHQPVANVTLRIDFHLVGTVLEKEESEFLSLFQRNEHRFRDMVLVEFRSAEVPDLTEPGLGLIKRRILEKSNALFGKPLLRSIVFSEFSFLNQ